MRNISLDFRTAKRAEPSDATHPGPASKRAFDVVFATLGLVMSAPIWLVVPLAIKLEDGGPVFYPQERWGKGGRPFAVWKFRTMVRHSDRNFGIVQAKSGDPRITKVGRILRAMGLDEIPQLINIVKGDMSLVGPRALAVGETFADHGTEPGSVAADNPGPDGCAYARYPRFEQRLRVRPGLTSVATIYLPKDARPERKFLYDTLYIRRQSLWLDFRLVLLSVWISVSGHWEKGERTRQFKH